MNSYHPMPKEVVDWMRELIKETDTEKREDLIDIVLEGYCSHCYRTLKEDELCHCWNDE